MPSPSPSAHARQDAAAQRALRRKLVMLVVCVAGVLGLAAAWAWTPMRAWLDVDLLVSALRRFGESFGPAAAIVGLTVALTLAVPLTFLTLVALVAYGPWTGFMCVMAGALCSAALSYGMGRMLGREVVERLAGPRINEISRKLAVSGLMAVLAVRLVPIAPFAMINMVAGASHIHLRDVLLGSAIGMAPGALAMAFFADQIAAALREPRALPSAFLALAVLLVGVGGWAMQRWVRRQAAE